MSNNLQILDLARLFNTAMPFHLLCPLPGILFPFNHISAGFLQPDSSIFASAWVGSYLSHMGLMEPLQVPTVHAPSWH